MIASSLLFAALLGGQPEPPTPTPLGVQVRAPRPTVRHAVTPTPNVPLAPLKIRSRKERMDRYMVAALRRANVDSWLVVTREGTVDPVAFDVAADHAVGRAACLFVDKGDRLERVAIVASYDTDTFEKSGLYSKVVPYGKEGAGPALKEAVETLNPKLIAVDMSKDEPLADGLTAGNLQWLRDALGPDYAKRLVSAEAFLVAYRSRKTPAEIAKLREAVRKTEQILAEALTPAVIKPGTTTEKDLADFIRKRRREMGLGPSWEEDQDPNVMAGAARGHSAASDAAILPGSVVRVDFGVDDSGYKTDIQRLAYVLRPGETEAPVEVAAAFATVRAANRAAAAALKPGATGTAVDTAALKVQVEDGHAGDARAAAAAMRRHGAGSSGAGARTTTRSKVGSLPDVR